MIYPIFTAAHYMEFDGKAIISMTHQERNLVGLPFDKRSVIS